MAFEPNVGQTDPTVKFISRGQGYTLFLTDGGAVIRLRKGSSGGRGEVIRMEFARSQAAAQASGGDPLPGKSNYFIGRDPSRWHGGVSNFRRVQYQGIYPGIDVAYYGTGQQLEYDFVVAPGTQPETIRMRVEGAKALWLDKSGDLVLRENGGEVRFKKPDVYQMVGGTRQAVTGRYALRGREVTFRVGHYDRSQPLIIDPVLSYSTYLGGSNIDSANAIAVGSDGTAFVVGETDSLDFPTVHPLQPNAGGPLDFPDDAFVAKLSADGSTLLYSTYLGGKKEEKANGIALDTFGNAFITGTTLSDDFPTTPGSFHPNCGCDGKCNATIFINGLISSDAFVTELNPAGSAIVYSSLISGLGNTRGLAISVDNNGSAYVTGATDAVACPAGPFPFPWGTNGFQPAFGGSEDGFVVKVDPTGSSIQYATYLGGSQEDDGFGIAADNANNAYATGLTCSSDFPTKSSLQAYAGNCDAFVTKVDTTQSAGADLIYSTYLGGAAKDQGNAIALDKPPTGVVYLTGVTNSANFPTTLGVFHTACTLDALSVCEGDAFVTKITGAAVPVLGYSTYFGGSGADTGTGIALDTGGNAYVTGFTNSTQSSSPTAFPTTGNAFQATYGGGNTDAFVIKLNSTGTSPLVYSSFLGGSNADNGTSIAVDSLANAYVTGQTCSTDFPTHFPEQATPGGNCDAFVSKVLVGPDIFLTPTNLVFPAQGLGTVSASQTITLQSNGDSSLVLGAITISGQFLVQSDTCSGVTLAPSSTCTVDVSFAPTSSGSQGGSLSIPDNAASTPQTVTLSGLVTNVFPLPIQLNFGNQLVGSTSAGQPVTLTNASGSALTILGIDTTGDFSQHAPAVNGCTNSLPSGSSCTVEVNFTPTAAGIRTGSLIFTDSNSSSPQTVTLTGHGNAPVVSLSKSALNFGTQGASGPAQTVTLTNAGDGALQIDSIIVSAPFAQTNNCPTNPAYLAAGAFCTLTVTFIPTSPGTFSGQLTISDNASPSSQSVALSGTAQVPVVDLSPTSLTFTGTSAGVTTPAQTVVLTNSGSASLTITSATLTGVNAAEFTIASNTCPATLAAGANCAISITFTPNAPGTQLAALSIADNAPGSPQTVSLTGIVPDVSVTPAALSFPDTAVGATSAPLTVTIANSGSATLIISSIVPTGDFSKSDQCGASIAAGANCTVNVAFTPTAPGNRYGTLTITDSAANSPQTVALAGNGVAAPVVSLSPTNLIFPSTSIGATSSAQTVTLTNTGTATLNITGISLTGANAGDFGQINNCAASLAANDSCTIGVTFTPTATGARNASVSIVDNVGTQSVPLTGTGSVAGATALPNTLTFASQATGTTSSPQTVTLTNSTASAITISSVVATTSFAQTNNCPASLAAGTSCTVNVTFTPQSATVVTGSLTFTDTAPNSPQVVSLTGNGAAPTDFSLSLLNLSATVVAGQSARFNLTVSSLSGFSGTVNLACTSPNSTIGCVPSATSVQISGTNPASVNVNVSTIARVMSPPGGRWKFNPPAIPWQVWISLASMLLLAMLTALATRRRRVLAGLGLAAALLLEVACGGGSLAGVPRGTPAGNYTLTITGTSGSLAHSTTVTLTVQ